MAINLRANTVGSRLYFSFIHFDFVMMADWTNENVLRLIEIYRSKEIIWNPAIKNHFNKTLKNDVWKEIASELSDYIATAITSNDRKNKMFSINAAYRRGKMKIRKSVGTGSGKSILPTLNYLMVNIKFVHS